MSDTFGGYQLWPFLQGLAALGVYFGSIALALLLGWRERASMARCRCSDPTLESDDDLTEFGFSNPRWEE